MKGLFILAALLALPTGAPAATIDRVVAYIDDSAITQRELDSAHVEAAAMGSGNTRMQTLEGLINTRLIVMEAGKLSLKGSDDSDIVRRYIELKVRAMVFVRQSDVRDYYMDNREKFGGLPLEKAAPEIRAYLEEAMFNRRLREHISELRGRAHIRILVEGG